MAVSNAAISVEPAEQSYYSRQVVSASNWVLAHSAPDAVESDSGVVIGGKVVKPGAITRAAVYDVKINNKASTLLVALKYNEDTSTLTAPVIRVFGKDASGIWHVLKSGSDDEVTLAVDAATDPVTTVVSTDYRISVPVSFDLQGSQVIRIGVQTAFNASSGTETDSEILVKGLTSN